MCKPLKHGQCRIKNMAITFSPDNKVSNELTYGSAAPKNVDFQKSELKFTHPEKFH